MRVLIKKSVNATKSDLTKKSQQTYFYQKYKSPKLTDTNITI